MILTGKMIEQEVAKGTIVITPFDKGSVNPNSYNVTLGNTLKVYTDKILDPKKQMNVHTITIPEEGFVLEADKVYLGHTEEIIGSDYFVPIIKGRSSTGRLGLFVHITADLIDIGSCNQLTFMLHAVQNVRIYPGMKIGQITFWVPEGEIDLYDGKYNRLNGPQESKIFNDFA